MFDIIVPIFRNSNSILLDEIQLQFALQEKMLHVCDLLVFLKNYIYKNRQLDNLVRKYHVRPIKRDFLFGHKPTVLHNNSP